MVPSMEQGVRVFFQVICFILAGYLAYQQVQQYALNEDSSILVFQNVMEEVQPYVASRKRVETHVSTVDITSARHRSAAKEEDNDINEVSFTRSNSRVFTEKLLLLNIQNVNVHIFSLVQHPPQDFLQLSGT